MTLGEYIYAEFGLTRNEFFDSDDIDGITIMKFRHNGTEGSVVVYRNNSGEITNVLCIG